jgi:DNA polymerase
MSDDIIEQVTDYLRYRTECGERTVELEAETVAALRAMHKTGAETASRAAGAAPPAARETPPPKEIVPTKPDTLADIAAECAACSLCGLCEGRKQAVPGQGRAENPDIMFIGEAPGADEDEQGLAFVGRAGQLLTKMIAAMGYTRDEVFIANICKCRPPNNRTPTPPEMAACIPFLKRQIALIKPKYIVALGNTAILGLLEKTGIMRLHGVWQEFEGIPLMPTFHPAYLLRAPAAKRDCWKDLQLVMAKLGKTP